MLQIFGVFGFVVFRISVEGSYVGHRVEHTKAVKFKKRDEFQAAKNFERPYFNLFQEISSSE